MVSCSFLVLITMASLPNPSMKASIVTMCFIAFTLIIWNCYQDRHAAGWAFYAYFASVWLLWCSYRFLLSADTLALHDILLQLFQRPHILSFADRSNSSLLVCIRLFRLYRQSSGTFRPLYGYHRLSGTVRLLPDHPSSAHQLRFIVILGLLGTIHFIHSSYADKIRTRMIYDSFITLSIVTWVFMILQPQHENELCGIMIANTAPLIAHLSPLPKERLPILLSSPLS